MMLHHPVSEDETGLVFDMATRSPRSIGTPALPSLIQSVCGSKLVSHNRTPLRGFSLPRIGTSPVISARSVSEKVASLNLTEPDLSVDLTCLDGRLRCRAGGHRSHYAPASAAVQMFGDGFRSLSLS